MNKQINRYISQRKECEKYKIMNVYSIFKFRRFRDLNVNQNRKFRDSKSNIF